MGIWIWVILAVLIILAGLALLMGRRRDESRGAVEPVSPGDDLEEAEAHEALEVHDPHEARVSGEGTERSPADAPTEDDGAEPALNFAFDGVTGADRFGPAVLAAGSRISKDGQTYLIAGTGALKFEEEIWYEHLLQGGDSPHWLSVENIDGHIRLGWWTNRAELGSDDTVEQIPVDGREYHRLTEGDGVFAVSGLTGAVTQGEYRFVDFATEDSRQLLRFETWGEDATPGASTGHFISHEDIEVHPPEPRG